MIRLGQNEDQRLIIASDETLPSDLKRVEYYREQKLFMFVYDCLLYTSPSPRDLSTSRMPSSA